MAKMYYNGDTNAEFLNGKKVAVIGYGSQGHAHALNLKESGVNVSSVFVQGKSWDKAVEDGFEVYSVGEATAKADVVMILLPDEQQAKVYKEEIEPNLNR